MERVNAQQVETLRGREQELMALDREVARLQALCADKDAAVQVLFTYAPLPRNSLARTHPPAHPDAQPNSLTRLLYRRERTLVCIESTAKRHKRDG